MSSLAFVVAFALAASEGRSRIGTAVPNDNTKAAGALRDGVLSISLEMKTAMWYPDGDTLPGLEVQAFAESGGDVVVPGPLLRMPVGTRVGLNVRNSVADTLTFFMPRLQADQSSTQEDSIVVPPGATRTLSFTAQHAGNYSYRANDRSALNKVLRIRSALTGALVVDSGPSAARLDRVFLIQLVTDSLFVVSPGVLVPNDGRAIFAINGRSWPHTERLNATVGDSLHWRVINASATVHPIHLHGFYFRVDNTNAAANEQRAAGRMVVTERLAPFSAMSMTWVPERAGNWIMHCHIPAHMQPHRPLGSTHVEHTIVSDVQHHALTGMGGLVLGIHVDGVRATGQNESREPLRRLRLVAVQDSGFPESTPSLRFRLEERGVATADAGPGFSPPIVLQRGQPVSIMVVNHLREHTAVHWHGIELQSFFDGVPGYSGSSARISPIIAPSDSFEARFTPPRAGTFMYHSHVDERRQFIAGMVGALIVQEGSNVTPRDEFTFLLKTSQSDGLQRRVDINGQSDPDTIVLRLGQATRLRFINLTANNHSAMLVLTARPDSAARPFDGDPRLLHWRLLAKDGASLPQSDRQLTTAPQPLSIGETRDLEVTPTARGQLRIEIRGAGVGGALLARVPVRVE